MARNVEVLRNYFLGKDPQLKETLSDNSLRLIGIEGRHFVLRTELIQRIKELKDYVDEQDKDLQEAIDTLADTLENEIDRLENKYNITEDTRLYELDNGVYRVITPEIRLYFKQNGSMINDDDLILIKEAKSFFIFSTVPSTDHPAMTYGIADASNGWRKDIKFEEIEQTTNKKNTITQNSNDYPSGLAVFNALSNYYTKGQVDALISFIPEFDIDVVETLPTQDISTTTIYLVPSQDPQTANSYDEFIYVNNNWEQIGSTAIDLSNYYTKEEVDGKVTFTRLTANITLPEHSATIAGLTESGWYNTGDYVINWEGFQENPIMPNNTLFYYDITQEVLSFIPQTPDLVVGPGLLSVTFYFDELENKWTGNSYMVTDTINSYSSDYQIPTAGAVYTQLQTKQNTLTAGTNISISSGTISVTGDTIKDMPHIATLKNLDAGVYRIKNTDSLEYIGQPNPVINVFGGDGIMCVTKAGDYTYCEIFLGHPSNGSSEIMFGYQKTSDSTGSLKTLTLNDIKTSAFAGTDGVNAGTIGLVPAPTASDVNKYLKSDGTWAVTGGGIEELTSSTINIWELNAGFYKIKVGNSATALYYNSSGSKTIHYDTYLVVTDTESNDPDPIKYFYLFYPPWQQIDVTVTYPGYGDFCVGWSVKFSNNTIYGDIKTVKLGNMQFKSNLVTSISASSTDSQYPSAKCVYDALQNAGGPTITYGTTDLTPGVSPLADGEFYFCYE